MNRQDPPVFVRDIQKADDPGQWAVLRMSVFQSAWTTIEIIPAVLPISLLERYFQRLLFPVLKLSWLKASGRVKAGSGIQGFLNPLPKL